MFARTARLTLRPAWPEDAPALAAAIGSAGVARMLGGVSYPYPLADAEAWIAEPRGGHDPRFLIMAHRVEGPELVGGIGIFQSATGAELGYWLKPDVWGLGYATEAGRAVIETARHALPIRWLGAWHFLDNHVSGRVLRKLGFKPTGRVIAKDAHDRQADAPCIHYELDLDASMTMPVAA